MADDYLTGATYLMQAGAFRSCINTLIDEMDKTPDGMPANFACLPVYFLASHDMELLLKAALLKRGEQNSAARAFLDYLKSDAARRVISAYGYGF